MALRTIFQKCIKNGLDCENYMAFWEIISKKEGLNNSQFFFLKF